MRSDGKIDVLWPIEAAKRSVLLLNRECRSGASRLNYLRAFGVSQADPKMVADALVAQAMSNLPGVVKPRATGPDPRRIEGTVQAPDGRAMPVRTVWVVRQGSQDRMMRVLTAIPVTR